MIANRGRPLEHERIALVVRRLSVEPKTLNDKVRRTAVRLAWKIYGIDGVEAIVCKMRIESIAIHGALAAIHRGDEPEICGKRSVTAIANRKDVSVRCAAIGSTEDHDETNPSPLNDAFNKATLF
jgi:hypothetical protein